MLIDSRAFRTTFLGRQKHENPVDFLYETHVTFAASGLRIDPYHLEDGYLDVVDQDWKPVPAKLVSASSFTPEVGSRGVDQEGCRGDFACEQQGRSTSASQDPPPAVGGLVDGRVGLRLGVGR